MSSVPLFSQQTLEAYFFTLHFHFQVKKPSLPEVMQLVSGEATNGDQSQEAAFLTTTLYLILSVCVRFKRPREANFL